MAESAISDMIDRYFGDLLRQHRERAGLSQEELAAAAGLSVRAVSDMERGRTSRPHGRSVRMLAEALNLSAAAQQSLIRAARDGAQNTGTADVGGGGIVGPVPRQLPAAPGHFAGRLDELKVLDGLLERALGAEYSAPVCAIIGTAGVGKTALAVDWAHKVSNRFPDGQLYVNMHGFDPSGAPMSAAEAIRSFLDALEVPAARIPTAADAQASLYRTVLADRAMLILLDNVLNPEQVRPLLPGSRRSVVVITSRNDLTSLVAVDSALPLAVDLMTSADAHELLARRLGAERLTGAGDAAAELIRLCSRLPLALAIGAARAALQPERSLASVAAELRDSASRLDSLAAGDALSDARSVFSWSYRELSDQAAGAFRLLGVHPGPDVSAAAAASLLGVSPAEARQILRELAGAHLVAEQVPGRYSMHDLLRIYAAELAETDSPAVRQTAITRVLDHYLGTACNAAGQLDPSRPRPAPEPPEAGVRPEEFADSGAALAWFQAERQVLIAVETLAASSGLDRHAVKLPWAMTTYLGRTGQWHGWAVLQRIALAAAERSGDRAGQARIQVSLGRADERLGRLEDSQSHLIHAVELYRALDDHAGQGDVHITMARILEVMGRQQASLSQAEEAVVQFRLAGNIIGQGDALNTVGWQHILLGQYEQALTVCREAFNLCRQAQNRFGEAATWDSIGYAHYHLGQATEAITCYEQGLSIVCDLGDRSGQAAIRDHMGDAYLLTGDPQRARLEWEQALAILQDMGHADASGIRAKLDELRPTAVERIPPPR
jgi:tetratricopeptide (TPR) repeat protein/transcriptional regulator with XRE-family HTH domain